MGQQEIVLEMLKLMAERFGEALYETVRRENEDLLGLQVKQKDTEAFAEPKSVKPYGDWIQNETPEKELMSHGMPKGTKHAQYIWSIVQELGRLERKMLPVVPILPSLLAALIAHVQLYASS